MVFAELRGLQHHLWLSGRSHRSARLDVHDLACNSRRGGVQRHAFPPRLPRQRTKSHANSTNRSQVINFTSSNKRTLHCNPYGLLRTLLSGRTFSSAFLCALNLSPRLFAGLASSSIPLAVHRLLSGDFLFPRVQEFAGSRLDRHGGLSLGNNLRCAAQKPFLLPRH